MGGLEFRSEARLCGFGGIEVKEVSGREFPPFPWNQSTQSVYEKPFLLRNQCNSALTITRTLREGFSGCSNSELAVLHLCSELREHKLPELFGVFHSAHCCPRIGKWENVIDYGFDIVAFNKAKHCGKFFVGAHG